MKSKNLIAFAIVIIIACMINTACAVSTQTYTEQLQSSDNGSKSDAFTLTNITKKEMSSDGSIVYYGNAPVQITLYTAGEVTWHCSGNTMADYSKYLNSFVGNPYYGDDIKLTNGVGYLAKSGIYTIDAGFRFQSASGLTEDSGERYSVIVSNPAVNTIATATPNISKIAINGKSLSLQGYNISGLNYFKIRDVAMAIKDTPKRVQIQYYDESGKIMIASGQSYTPAGGELSISSVMKPVKAKLVEPDISLDGFINENLTTAYNINGNSYYKLRDIAKALDFGTSWDDKTSLININTSIGYIN